MQVLWEDDRDGRWQGLTGNYISVYLSDPGDLSNRLLPTHLTDLDDVGGIGFTTVPTGVL